MENGGGTTEMKISLSVFVRVLPATRSGSAEFRTNGCIVSATDGRFFRANAGSQVRLSD